ncbi:MAG: hypothetical protein ACI4NZ_01250 [Candidatus Enterousia sp.]
MIYYKNIFLNISNSLNSRQVSNKKNPYSNTDALFLACSCQTVKSVVATNGKKYYYFVDDALGTRVVQYLLNANGVLAYRRYSGYRVFYRDLREVVRVPADYVASHPQAKVFINKIIDAQFNQITALADIDMSKYLENVQNRMRHR